MAETIVLRRQVRQEAQTAEERLAPFKRDYLVGRISAEAWSESRHDLTGGVEAAQAQAARLELQVADVEGTASIAELEAEVLERLTAVRSTLAGEASH